MEKALGFQSGNEGKRLCMEAADDQVAVEVVYVFSVTPQPVVQLRAIRSVYAVIFKVFNFASPIQVFAFLFLFSFYPKMSRIVL